MPKKKTPSFIVEYPIIVDSQQERELNARFNAGFRLLNAIQSEALIRMELVRNSEAWAEAKKLPRRIKNALGEPINNPERAKAFEAAKKQYRFTDFDLQAYGSLVAKNSVWIDAKLDAQSIQKIGTRVFKAVNKILLGKAKKVRFKNNRSFSSMEGKQITTGIRVDRKTETFVWRNIKCRLIIDRLDPCEKHGWEQEWKYARIVRRELNGKTRWWGQIICEGIPLSRQEKHPDKR